MEFTADKKSIVVFSKKISFDTLIDKLAELSGEQVKGFFANRAVKIPRKLNALALMKILNNRIKKLNSLSMNKDSFSKLAHYKEFTEFQLQTLFDKVGTDEDFLEYRKELWTLIFRNNKIFNFQDGEVQYLHNLRKLHPVDFKVFSNEINSVLVDLKTEFDACPKDKIEAYLNESFSSEDIRQLAAKYGITIPNRLKKEELLVYVKMILSTRGRISKAFDKELDGMTVAQLNSLCEVNKLNISTNLKKPELIFLFLFLINEKKLEESNYSKLVFTDRIKPLDFTVDVSVVDAFGRGTPKQVIFFNDEEQLEPEEEEEEALELPEEPKEEPTTTEEAVLPFTIDGMNVVANTTKKKEKAKKEPEPKEEPVKEEPIVEKEPEPVEEKIDETEPEEVEETEPEAVEETEPEEVEETESEEVEETESEEVEETEPEAVEETESEEVEESESEEVEESEPEEVEESEEDDFDDDFDEDEDDDDDDFDDFAEPEPDEELDEEINSDEDKKASSEEDNDEEFEDLEDESYDDEFLVAAPKSESEDPITDPINNPYFRSKKLVSKKKNIIICAVVTALIVGAIVAMLLLMKYLN